MKKLLSLFLIVMLTACSNTKDGPAAIKQVSLTSPDGSVQFQLNNTRKGLRYQLERDGKIILKDSGFSLNLKEGGELNKRSVITNVEKVERDRQWQRVWGKQTQVIDHFREARISVRESKGAKREFELIVRTYNDGLAIRYRIPEQIGINRFHLLDEKIDFNFAEDFDVWATKWKRIYSHQEKAYVKSKLSELVQGGQAAKEQFEGDAKKSNEEVIGTPLLVDVKEAGYAAIFEANLTDWAGMVLRKNGQLGLSTQLANHDKSKQDVRVISMAPRYSPWRVIALGDDAGKLIESNILHNLNEANAIGDTSWIEPGISAWDWWWSGNYAPEVDFEVGSNTETMKYYIDFAAEMGWEYQLVDWQWYGEPFDVNGKNRWAPNPDADILTPTDKIDIEELVKYGKKKGVKILIWLESHHTEEQMAEAFPLYEKWGVAGIKIDFMASLDQTMVNFYHDVMKLAAKHKLLVNMHGAYMPTGISRTYPNFITREGVMGNEHNKWSTRITPDHITTIPFTRMLLGHMDFTPGGFNHRAKGEFKAVGAKAPAPQVMGTRAMQLAMFVVYESALQVACDSPAHYREQAGLNFLKQVPTTWDESIVLNGKISDYITMARRSGNDWYVGALNDWDERELEIKLDFLPAGKFKAHIWADGDNANTEPADLKESTIAVNRNSTIKMQLKQGGGQAIRISPIK